MFEEDVSLMRRLPVYLLIDTSHSMRGAPIQAVNEGLRLLKDTLLDYPMAVEVAYLSVITFDTEARQVVPLISVVDLELPELVADGKSAMGAGLKLLNEILDRELILNAPERKGDYRPLVFIMTDGRPSDGWKRAAKTLRDRDLTRPATVVGLGCGPQADMEVLGQVADVALSISEATPESIHGFFLWVSQSIRSASISSSVTFGSNTVEPPPLPPDICRILL